MDRSHSGSILAHEMAVRGLRLKYLRVSSLIHRDKGVRVNTHTQTRRHYNELQPAYVEWAGLMSLEPGLGPGSP